MTTTLGVLGGGQLGRMLALDAKQHGIRVLIRTDEAAGGPAAQVADGEYLGPYSDHQANVAFAQACDAVTSEFENLPAALLDELAQHTSVRPSSFSLATCQHRRREKEFLASQGLPHAPFRVIHRPEQLAAALDALGGVGILKTASFGYDGKGQSVLRAGVDFEAAWRLLSTNEAVLEGFVPFIKEISVIGCRGSDGTWVSYPVGENVHVNGILDYALAPARISDALATRADELARCVADALGHVGTIGVEMFVLECDELVINEMAPRPHNSGHHTVDSCQVSQFGQQWRAALGLPLGPSTQSSPAVMLNLLGDLWSEGEPQWNALMNEPDAFLHLYGKPEARPGRKMGHLTVLGSGSQDLDAVVARGKALRRSLNAFSV